MDHAHPIRVVARRTGMSPHLIRMWERRYSAIKPHRTATGHRLYTDNDIERLVLLRRATLEGQSISQIAQLTTDQLRALTLTEVTTSPESSAYQDNKSVEYHFNLCLQSMKNLDARELELRLLRASVNLGQRTFLEKLLHPLLEMTGEMWSDGRIHVAHEHLASAILRSLLGSMHSSNTYDVSSPLFISASPIGQHHEFGAMMASITADTSGWRSLYLGANLPAEDIIETAETRKADAIGLSIVYSSDDPPLPGELRKFRPLIKRHVRLLVGGRSAVAYENVLTEIGAIRIVGLADLRRELQQIRRTSPLTEVGQE